MNENQKITFTNNLVICRQDNSITYNNDKITKANKFFNEVFNKEKIKNNNFVNVHNPPKKRRAKRTATIKTISKEALISLKEKSSLLANMFEKEDTKRETVKTIGRRKSLELGVASGLLLEKKNDISANVKLNLSRIKARIEQFLHTQYFYNCKIQAFLAMATIITSIIEYESSLISVTHGKIIHTYKSYEKEAYFYNINESYFKRLGRISYFCSYLSIILSVFLWITIYYDKILINTLLNGKQQSSIKYIIRNWKKLFKFIFNFLLFFLCPNPFTYKVEISFYNSEYDYYYKIPINTFFTAVCLFRSWFLFKLYLVSSKSYNKRSFRISKINGVKLGLYFPFKANIATYPFIINFILFIMCWILCSYILRLFERYFDEVNGQDLGNFINDLWCVFISMTTVGYGDISPKSFFGKIIIIFCSMFGLFLIGLLVISVTNYLTINGLELNVYIILLKAIRMEERDKRAFKTIAQYLKSIKEVNKKMNIAEENDNLNKIVSNQKKEINNYLKDFKIADSEFLKTIPSLNDFDNIGQHLRFVEENMIRNKDRMVETADLLDQLNSVFHNV